MKDKKIKSYNRNHNYDYPVDEEISKISKEKDNYKKINKHENLLIKNLSKSVKHSFNEEEIDDYHDKISFQRFKAKKEINNAKTHKKRLKDFSNEDEFQ